MTGGPLKVYDVTIGTNTTQMRLNDDDAKFYQEHHKATLAGDQTMAAEAPSQPPTDDVAAENDPPTKSRTTANKLGGASNK